MGPVVNRVSYAIEVIMIVVLVVLTYFVAGDVMMVTKDLLIFTLIANIFMYRKEVMNIVPHWLLKVFILLNGVGIWFQYIMYGANPDTAPMNYYLLVDVLTAFVMIFVIYLLITRHIKNGIREMSFGHFCHYYDYMMDYKIFIIIYVIVTLFISVELMISYTTIREYLLLFAPEIDSFYLKYLQYFIFLAVPNLIGAGLLQLLKDLEKEVEKSIEELQQKEKAEKGNV